MLFDSLIHKLRDYLKTGVGEAEYEEMILGEAVV